MADIIVTDEKILRQKSEWVSTEELPLMLDLCERMWEVVPFAWTKGYGLAAVQIGILKRVAFFAYAGKMNVLLNPEITIKIGKRVYKEGCLSIPHKWFMVERAFEIEYISEGKKRRAAGTKAQIIQHEVDHMNGILVSNIGVAI